MILSSGEKLSNKSRLTNLESPRDPFHRHMAAVIDDTRENSLHSEYVGNEQ